jgi:aspartate racemase
VGVIGGLGPGATLDFFARVLKATPAVVDQDHIRLIIDNNPAVPDRNAGIAGTGPSPGPWLAEMARGLERAGADFLVMPCNAAHAFEAEIRAATSLPFISLIGETVRAVKATAPKARRAGLLAIRGTVQSGVYADALAAEGVETLSLQGEAMDRFMALVGRIKAGDTGEVVRLGMRALAAEQVAAGAEVLIAGCTEVPIVLDANDVSVPLISTTDVLVARTVAIALGGPIG